MIVVSGYFQVLISQQEPIGCLVALELSRSWWRWSCVSYQSETLTLAQHSLQISLANGSTHTSHYATTLVMQSHSQHFSTHTFQLIALGNYAIILGMDWLRLHNPYIDWEKRTVTMPCLHQHTPDKLSPLAQSTMPRSIPAFQEQDRILLPPSKPKATLVPTKHAPRSNQLSKSAKNRSATNISIISNTQLRQILKTNQGVGYMLDVSRI